MVRPAFVLTTQVFYTRLEYDMSLFDKAKGKLKEARGDLTDDDKRRAEGKADQAKGDITDAGDSAKDAADSAKDAARNAIR